jgi:parallel beta-helix repeat protein
MGAARRTGPTARTAGAAALALLVAAGAIHAVAEPASAKASVLHVAQRNSSCSDNGAGTRARPFCSISAAAAVAQPGQRVIVRSGRYLERVVPGRSGAPGQRITYAGAKGAHVVIRGQEHGFVLTGKSWITIRRFLITATSGHGIKVSTADHVAITDTEVSHAGEPSPGKTAKGIVLRSVSAALVARNVTRHNSNAGISVIGASTGVRILDNSSFSNARGFTRAAAGIDLRGSRGSVVSGNTAYANEDSGINVWTGSQGAAVSNNVVYRNGDHGIDVNQSDDVTVVANTVHRNVDSGIEVTGSLRAQILNNISAENGIDSPRTSGDIRIDAASAPSLVLDYNLLNSPALLIDWAGQPFVRLSDFTSATGRETHGIQADPRFRDSSGGDYRLAPDSPAIDSANSAAARQPVADARGRPRVDVAAVADTGSGSRTYDDRGAYEYHA